MNPIISLTTIPDRLHNTQYNYDIKYVIQSLLDMNYDEYEIHFNIPHTYSVTNEEYIIPDWLNELCKKNSFLKIFRTDDHGSVTKLLPTVNRILDPETIIIVCDDDMIYHPELINEHIKNQSKWPEYAVGYDGMSSRSTDGSISSFFGDSRDYYFSANHRNSLVDILQHYKTVSYRRRFFKDDFQSFIDKESTWNDDISLAAYFSKHKRGRLTTYYDKDPEFKSHDEWVLGIARTFPIVRTSEHNSKEGCNLNRQASNQEGVHEVTNNLYRTYINVGYEGGGWAI